MRFNGLRRCATFILLAVATIAAGGCSTWPKDINVKLETAPNEAPPSLNVHFIPARSSDVARLKRMSLNEYWSTGGASRSPMPGRKDIFLGPGATSKTIPGNDPVWKTWDGKTYTYLFVVADLRGMPDREGTEDPRRVILPLKPDRWPSGLKVIRLAVSKDRLRLLTPYQ